MFRMPYSSKSSDGATNNGLLAVSTNVFEELEVIGVAVKLAFVFVTISSLEFTTTLLTTVMLGMHFLTLDSDILANNGLLAFATNANGGVNDHYALFRTHHAIGLTFIILVGLAAKLSATARAEKAFWVVYPVGSVDTLVYYGLQARVALGTVNVVEIIIAPRLSLVFNKASSLERFATVDADKALWVESFVHGIGDRSNNHFGTGSTRRSCEVYWSSVRGVGSHRSSSHHRRARPTRHSSRTT